MTEVEWIASEDPQLMLEFVQGKVSVRKAVLIACACVRRAWNLLHDDRLREGVRIAELYVDGEVTLDERRKAISAAHRACGKRDSLAKIAYDVARLEGEHTLSAVALELRILAREIARVAVPNPARRGWESVRKAECAGQCHLLRHFVGNPFRPVTAALSWLAWNNATVPKLAQSIYDNRAFDLMPILADAQEDAGCTNLDILEHCRGNAEHVRGCWVVDLILGKS